MFEFPIHLFSDRAMIALFGVIASILLGGPGWLHAFLFLDRPAKISRRVIIRLGEKLNRPMRTRGSLRFRSMLYLLFTLGLCLIISGFFGRLAMSLPELVIVEILLVAYLLPIRSLLDKNGEMVTAIKTKNTVKAETLASISNRYEAIPEDKHAFIRLTIEEQFLGFSRRVVAPVLAYLLLGLPAMLMTISLHVMDRNFGSKHEDYQSFGALPARLNTLIQLIPSRLSALLIALASLLSPGCNAAKALASMVKGSFKMQSSNSGCVLGAVAGALKITLAGRRKRLSESIEDKWIDFGTAKVSLSDLKRANILCGISVLLLLLLLIIANLGLAL